MFTPTRDEARRFLIDAWASHRSGRPPEGLARTAAAIIAMHPEYHALLENADADIDRDWKPEAGEVNPFLHLSLHLAVAEQLAIDQPHGIRAQFERLRGARGDEHLALHAVLDCLGEVVWQAQRLGAQPDAQLYIDCLQRQG